MIQLLEEAGRLRIMLPGRLDTVQSAAIQDELLKLVGASTIPVVFDMQGVEFVASGFLRICIMAQRLGKSPLALANATPMVRRVFTIAGLENYFAME